MENRYIGHSKTVLALLGAAVVIYSGLTAVFGEKAVTTVHAQSDQFVARRVDQMEQRFYSLESRLSRLEQDSRRIDATPGRTIDTSATELEFLRTQVNGLRTRVGEVECGLLQIDERTLTVAARAARARGQESERCRLNTARPVQLSARP
jgi:hypothetical protein